VEDAALSGDGKVAKDGQAKQQSKKRHERLIKNIYGSLTNTKCKLCIYSKLLRHDF
ncbi:hypothetical protein S245_013997, partial [Arachis hypogaea]